MHLSKYRFTYLSHHLQSIYAKVALCCLISSGFGVLCSTALSPIYISLMHISAGRSVSIVGSFVAVVVPYFVSVLVVTNFKRWLIYAICSVRIFLFTAAYFAISAGFGSAGWLIGLMLLFPDITLIPMLIFMSIRQFLGLSAKRDRVLAMVYIGVIGILNYCTVSPFLAMIIERFKTNG